MSEITIVKESLPSSMVTPEQGEKPAVRLQEINSYDNEAGHTTAYRVLVDRDEQSLFIGQAMVSITGDTHFLSFGVQEEYQGKGYGSAIFNAVDAMVQQTANRLGVLQKRIERIADTVDAASRDKVIHLLQQCGYTQGCLDDGEVVWEKTFHPHSPNAGASVTEKSGPSRGFQH